jgi:hypothetical protein
VRPTIYAGLLGITTQFCYNCLFDHYTHSSDKPPLLERIAKSKWMPLKSIPDEEYEAMLKVKIGKLDHEISMVESQIAALQKQKALVSKTP